MLYTLNPSDERALDISEGVPHCYIKKMLPIELLAPDFGTVEALVYVDVARPGIGTCREEYVARMNRGIRDASEKGMPKEYVDRVIRKWVRDEEIPDEREVGDPFHPEKMGEK
jgi:gamma-glutamylcyclotransferase